STSSTLGMSAALGAALRSRLRRDAGATLAAHRIANGILQRPASPATNRARSSSDWHRLAHITEIDAPLRFAWQHGCFTRSPSAFARVWAPQALHPVVGYPRPILTGGGRSASQQLPRLQLQVPVHDVHGQLLRRRVQDERPELVEAVQDPLPLG